MDGESIPSPSVPAGIKQVAHRLLAIAENRLRLFIVEVEEERDCLVENLILAVVSAALGLLAVAAWSAAIVVLFWHSNPAAVLLILGACYCLAALIVSRRLAERCRGRPPLSATLEQLEKDRACLK